MSSGPAVRNFREKLKVRRCVGCGTDDLRAAVGVAVELSDTAWRCPDCGATTWILAILQLPPERPAGDSCPYDEGPKS